MIICVTRFDTNTYNENKIYKDKYNITGCIYGSPIKISEKILPDTEILVLEMNNSKNIVEGIGVIKNNILHKKHKIYSDNNYNRFIYKSDLHICRSQLNEFEKSILFYLEKLLFKSHNHCKRGHGIQKLPDFIKEIKLFDFIDFIIKIYRSKLINN